MKNVCRCQIKIGAGRRTYTEIFVLDSHDGEALAKIFDSVMRVFEYNLEYKGRFRDTAKIRSQTKSWSKPVMYPWPLRHSEVPAQYAKPSSRITFIRHQLDQISTMKSILHKLHTICRRDKYSSTIHVTSKLPARYHS